MTQVQQEIDKLRAEIERHNDLYYVEAAPLISDEEFDALMRRLQALEAAHPELMTPDSPTQRVGGQPLEGFRTVEHAVPMLSMDNTYNPDELREFHGRVLKLLGEKPAYVVEPKIDGVSISMRYEKGRFVLGATRGDGRRGDDVTGNLRTIKSLPLRLRGNPPAVVEVRGEVYFTKSDFAEINQQREEAGEPTFANPRNSAAGTLKLLDPRLVAKRPLRVFAYGVGFYEGVELGSHWQTLARLREWGLPVNPVARRFEDVGELIDFCIAWGEDRHQLDYLVDGMVIKVDSLAHRKRLGETSKAPRWQVAYKYAAEQAVTRLHKIDVQVGKTGKLTPVAHLEPVLLSGTTVSRASLHNDEEIKRKDIREGDLVVVEKAGEIIPQVVAVKTELRTGQERPFCFPTRCPACGQPVQRDEGGVYIRCVNSTCPAQFKNLLEFFAHRNAMDIEGLGPALVEQLVDRQRVRSLPDLYRLKEQDLLDLERMGKRSAANLLSAIENSKGRGLTRLLTGLGIHHTGRRVAELLARHFGTSGALISASADELSTIEEIGPVIADSVYRYFHAQGGDRIIHELESLGVLTDEPEAKAAETGSNRFAGKTFVVTGTLERFSREEAHEQIRRHGGTVSSSISGKTSFLVVGESPGSKLAKAQKLGVEVVNEEQFLAMLEATTPGE